jgi:uncharacterized protein YdbL (DUF1318 family)
MRSWLASIAFVFALAFAGAAGALDLDGAKASGLVGEKVDGYVAAVAPNPSADVTALVAQVNAKRKATYQGIAEKNGTDVGEVGKLAAQKLLERAPKGAWIHADGKWYQKK